MKVNSLTVVNAQRSHVITATTYDIKRVSVRSRDLRKLRYLSVKEVKQKFDETMSNTITLRPEDIPAIVAGLAANNDALATMAQMMSNPTPPRETPLDQPPSSLSGQGSSSGKLLFHSLA